MQNLKMNVGDSCKESCASSIIYNQMLNCRTKLSHMRDPVLLLPPAAFLQHYLLLLFLSSTYSTITSDGIACVWSGQLDVL